MALLVKITAKRTRNLLTAPVYQIIGDTVQEIDDTPFLDFLIKKMEMDGILPEMERPISLTGGNDG